MKGFANGIIHSLAFVAILLMQPVGQQYCTAEDALCTSVFSSCHSDAQPDCCDHHSDQDEVPCCVELFAKFPFVPSDAVSLPSPVALDFLAPEPIDLFVKVQWNKLGAEKIEEIDPPPRAMCSLEHLCVRLI